MEMAAVVTDEDRAALEPALAEFSETLEKAMASRDELRLKPKKQPKVTRILSKQ